MRKMIMAFFLLSLSATPLFGQQDPAVDSGFRRYQAFQGSDVDSVNLVNGNLMLHIPIASYPQRGGILKLSFSARYNNVNWVVHTFTHPLGGETTQSWKFQSGGVAVSTDQTNKISRILDDNQLSGLDAIVVTTTDGATHILENADPYVSGSTTDADWRSIDGTGFLVNSSNYAIVSAWSAPFDHSRGCVFGIRTDLRSVHLF